MSIETVGTGKLITVAGIDGAGKSTLAASLHAVLTDAGQSAILVGKQTTEVPMSADLSEYLDSLNALVYRRKASVGPACGDHYWLFALAAWYSLQDRLVIGPALRSGTHVILDNAHHKILARYAVNREVPTQLAHQVFAHLAPPDVVLFLQVTAEEALRRKQEFSPLEAGRTGSTGEAFVSHQDTVTSELRRQAASEAWVSIDVTAKGPDIVLEQALAIVSELLGLQAA
ncbi:MAG: dTMP kinase [Pseudonocardiaceae bacterium]